MLGGRASVLELYPFTSAELLASVEPTSRLSASEEIERMIQWGGLPPIYFSKDPKREANDHITGYLEDEVQSEAIVRSLPTFLRFLTSAALINTEQVNFRQVSSEAQVPERTVKEYFQILEDTLFGSLLLSYRRGITRKPVSTRKFYLFDVEVSNALLKRWSIEPGTPEYGTAFEHFIWRELNSANRYLDLEWQMHFWRATSEFEVDFVLDRLGDKTLQIAIEAKGKKVSSSQDLKGLIALSQDFPKVRKIVVCREPIPRKTSEGIEIWPLFHFLNELWGKRV